MHTLPLLIPIVRPHRNSHFPFTNPSFHKTFFCVENVIHTLSLLIPPHLPFLSHTHHYSFFSPLVNLSLQAQIK
ncbi:hypothetical protein SUGI_0764050 [Cryptomeria japonica]|nr:hypothetical protein SUGI_0764050 [Cryptomeria japonica]